jgi:hypothetical protein
MDTRKKRHIDLNKLAAQIVAEATGQVPVQEEPATPVKEKNPAAVALGRLGGLKGGKARAEKLSAKKRKAIAQKAAKSRWANYQKKTTA